jgi:hypothetical protein
MEIALTGQLETTSSQLQSLHSSAITFDFPFSTLKTPGQSASQVPQPMHNSSFTFGFGICFSTNYYYDILNEIIS